jgi:Peptidase A4 family
MAMSPAQTTQGASPAVPPFVIEELKKRFHGFPVPSEPFDATTASPEQLQEFGLPPRPDPAQQPLLREAWDRAFGKRLILQPFSVEKRLIDDARYRLQVRRVYERLVTATRFETSRNWSGAYITANRGKHFIQIWGFWTIPGNLKLPPGGSPGIDYVCSNWIGLDGQRLYFDSSLPQIGTQSTLQANGTIKAEAWTQWWARDLLTNKPPAPLPNFAVAPGDQVAAVVTVIDPQTVNCVMINLSARPWPTVTSVMATSPPVRLPDKTIAMPEIAGATAEWVVERPAVYPPVLDPFGDPQLDNFPDYGETEFDLCLAVEGDSVDIGSLPTGLPQVLEGARRIRMFDVLQSPERAALISMPERRSERVVRASYGGFP